MYYRIIAIPLVIALGGVGAEGPLRVPALVFLAGTSIQSAHLRAVRGDTGADIFHNTSDVLVGQSQLAAGDFDGDGQAEVVYTDESLVHVLHGLDGRTWGTRGVLSPITVCFNLLLRKAVVSSADTHTTHTLLPAESELVNVALPLNAGP